MANRKILRAIVLPACIAGAIGLAPTVNAEDVVRQTFAAGAWRGVLTYDTGSTLLTCAIGRDLSDGAYLGFFRAGDEFGLRLINRSWRLKPGERIPVTYSVQIGIDGRPAPPAMAFQIDRLGRETVELFLDRPDFVLPMLRSGRTLTVALAGQAASYTLDGASEALAQLDDCRARYLVPLKRPPTRTNPFRAAASPAAPLLAQGLSGITADPRHVIVSSGSTAELFLNMLTILGYPQDGTRVDILAEDLQAEWGSYVYITADGLGVYWEEDSADPRRDTRTIAAGLAARWQAACGSGAFTTGGEPPATVGTFQVQSGQIACRLPAAAATVYYSLIDTGNSTMVLLTVANDEGRTAAQRLDRKLREVWVTTLGRFQQMRGGSCETACN